MKKILSILFSFLGIGLIACLVIGFCKKIDVTLLSKAVFKYKLSTGILLFSQILPALIFSGFALSCSIYFGRNSEGSAYRFSPAMVKRYKTVMIISLICTLILTLSTEVLTLTMKRNLEYYSNQPQIVNDYLKIGNNFLKQNKPEAAATYAKEVLSLDPSNKEAVELRNQADIQINLNDTNTSRLIYEQSVDSILFEKEDSDINFDKLSEVNKLYQKSKEAFSKEEWFNAHYYAETALKIASGKDANIANLKEISATAWNNITEEHDLRKTDEQDLFNQKYEGYKALMQEDYLTAYYILKNIQFEHPELRNDSDLYFYADIAESKVQERTFFIDETFELKSFETSNDVYFSLKYDDGWTDLIYFKGVTQVLASGGMIQYLRDFSVVSMDKQGNFFSSLSVPYAKVLKVSVKDMNPVIKDSLGIDRSINYVPYILMRSIDRYNEGAENKPVYNYANSDQTTGADYLMLRMAFDDFQLLENATVNPEIMPVTDLLKILSKAESYGYSSEVYGHTLLNRLLFPLFVLIAFILLASLAWNNRIGATQYFKMVWVFVFPVFAVICYFLFQVMEFAFTLLTFAMLETSGTVSALIWGFVALVACLFTASLIFLGRKATE